MNQVLKNMNNNVDKMENKIKLQENGMFSIKLEGVDKSCQSDLPVDENPDVKNEIKPVIEDTDRMHGKGRFESEAIKMEPIDVDTEIKEECPKLASFDEAMRLVAEVNNNIVENRTVTSKTAVEGTKERSIDSNPNSDRMPVKVKKGGDQEESFGTDSKKRKIVE